MEPLETLEKFVAGGNDPWKNRPFLICKDGVFWSVATCHHTLVAFKDVVAIEIPEIPELPFLWLPRDSLSIQVDKTKVREWTGVQDSILIGRTYRSVGPETQGTIIGVLLDLRKLAYLLDNLTSQKLFMWNSTDQIGVRSLGVESEDGLWRGYLAGLEGKAQTRKVFNESDTGYTDAFSLMLDLE